MDLKHSDLEASVQNFLRVRDRTIENLKQLRHGTQKHNVNMKKATIAASSISLAGTSVAVAGIALAPFTLGGSLALTAAGGAIAITGGAASIAANASDAWTIRKAQTNALEALLEEDRRAQEDMEEKSKRLQKLRQKQVSHTANYDSKNFVVPAVGMLKGVSNSAAGIGSGASTVAGTAAKAVSTISTGVVAVSAAITVPLDIYTIVKAAQYIKDEKKCDAVEYIDNLIEALSAHRAEVEKFYELLKAGLENSPILMSHKLGIQDDEQPSDDD